MQLPVSYPRGSRTPATFVNYLPRQLDRAPDSLVWLADSMIAPTGMTTFGSGVVFSETLMGQGHSVAGSSSAWRSDADASHAGGGSARLYRRLEPCEPSPPLSDDTGWMHYSCTNQAPYTSRPEQERPKADKMMTQTSFLTLPKGNASHDLAFFLRTTGPTGSHRRPRRIDRASASSNSTKTAFTIFRRSQRRTNTLQSNRSDRGVSRQEACLTGVPEDFPVLNRALRDEGGLLKDADSSRKVPRGVLQKVSTTGKKYYALQIPSTVSEERRTPENEPTARTNIVRTDVWDSHIAVSFGDEVRSQDVLDNWLMSIGKEQHIDTATDVPSDHPRRSSAHLPLEEDSTRFADPRPIRPAASSPPTPVLESQASPRVLPAVRSVKHPYLYVPAHIQTQLGHSAHRMPKISLPHEEFPVRHPSMDDDVEIRHPTPRRFASRPLLLENAAHTASSSYSRSVSDSPVPPPRSPLRDHRGPHTFESASQRGRETTSRLAPSVIIGRQRSGGTKTIRSTVITDCTGPIKRPKSRSPNRKRPAESRKERECRIQARKLRDRPNIAAVVNAGPSKSVLGQGLTKTSPHDQVSELRPSLLITRSPSTASSEISWRKVTESTRTPVSPLSPQDGDHWVALNRCQTPISPIEQPKSHFSPISPSKSVISTDNNVTSSPLMLVAESAPRPKPKAMHKPPKLLLKDSKQYAARPRSASTKRRSHHQTSSPPRLGTPVNTVRALRREEAPPLPSPPPDRALPPTPPRSRSHKTHLRYGQRAGPSSSRVNNTRAEASGIDARLEALEKQNALLSAALMAVLKTNGSYNLPQLLDAQGAETSAFVKNQGPMAWEHRIARRSAASHAASSSNGSALEMYMRTRQGSAGGT